MPSVRSDIDREGPTPTKKMLKPNQSFYSSARSCVCCRVVNPCLFRCSRAVFCILVSDCLSPPAPDDIPLQVFHRMHGCDTIKVSQSVCLSLHTLWTILQFLKETFFGIYGRTYCPSLNASSAVTISTPPLPSGVIQLCIPTFH